MTENRTPQLKALIESGTELNNALGELRANGATPIETIKAIREVCGVSLCEAKQQFSKSPAWHREVEAADKLHQELIEMFETEETEPSGGEERG